MNIKDGKGPIGKKSFSQMRQLYELMHPEEKEFYVKIVKCVFLPISIQVKLEEESV